MHWIRDVTFAEEFGVSRRQARCSVDGVGLAGMSGVQQPGPRGQLGGHVHDGFVGGGQALRAAAA